MRLFTLKSLAYPITVTKVLRRVGDDIEQNAPLFTYRYKGTNSEWDEDTGDYVEKERTYFSDFESEVEGNITALNIAADQVIAGPTQVAEIEEPCRHEVQFGGMCANCGKDMTLQQYNTTTLNTARATVNTVHGHTALLISREEASKANEEAKRRLLEARKLSLVVDLDQTIIHATVDPTVGDWQKDPSSPNYGAVKDVRSFQLIDDGPGGRGTWYYIKLRPGLQEFLERIAQDYELHIYTMATRAYAENIARIVDPDRKLFGERILSRDENGSMSSKNLKRLFPVDTNMVVIIDDRGDVWSWSPNLVKVVPYDFFVGIGDINSSFLPKRLQVEARPPRPTLTDNASDNESQGEVYETNTTAEAAVDSAAAGSDVSTVDRMINMAGNQDEASLHQQTDEQDKTIAAQLEDRPLERMQKILEEEEAKASPAVTAVGELLSDEGEENGMTDVKLAHHSKYRHNLLQDDDDELKYLRQSLHKIHTAFFDEYDRDLAGSKGGRVAELRPGQSKKRSLEDLDHVPDAAVIVADMKSRVLEGVHLVFSGVIPIGVDVQSQDLAVWARSFGASVSETVTKRTTHLIASPERRTAKVRQAARRKRIAIVNQNWLYACFSQWRRVDENSYRVHTDASTNDTGGLPDSFEAHGDVLSSSDEDFGQTEDETDESSIPTPEAYEAVPPLAVETDFAELEKHAPSMERPDSSPTDSENPDNWLEIKDDVDEFLGSDWDDDTDADSDSESRLEGHESGTRTPRKRKRGDDDDGKDDLGGDEVGSRLQKRKTKALGRTTSLTNVANAASLDDDDVISDAGDDDDDLEAALAAEMMKQTDEEVE